MVLRNEPSPTNQVANPLPSKGHLSRYRPCRYVTPSVGLCQVVPYKTLVWHGLCMGLFSGPRIPGAAVSAVWGVRGLGVWGGQDMKSLLMLTAMLLAPVQPALSYEWHTYNGHSYTVVSAVRWADGETQAIALGGHLVTINDQAENDWLVQRIVDPIDAFAWIGLYQLPSSTEPADGWVWVSGAPVSYTNWYGGEPNNLEGGENWGELYTSTFGGHWNDIKPETEWSPPLAAIVEVIPVPEPASLLALLCGVVSLTLLRRKRA